MKGVDFLTKYHHHYDQATQVASCMQPFYVQPEPYLHDYDVERSDAWPCSVNNDLQIACCFTVSGTSLGM